MKMLIGIDGGGTKTSYSLADENGNIVLTQVGMGCSYKQHGFETVLTEMATQVAALLRKANCSTAQVLGACVGLPCYGEAPAEDARFADSLRRALHPIPLHIVNDAEIGWAGSLAGQPGINVVAGTGSIAFGMDDSGHQARCGGWSWVFGDEGSCHWAGRKVMELFTKEADFRLPKGPLYTMVLEEFSLTEETAFIPLMENDYYPVREKTAALQKLLGKAAAAGDENAVAVYRQAAEELALMVKGVERQLTLTAPVQVSYSGGIFHAGELILRPLKSLLPTPAYTLMPPAFSPDYGSVLLAHRYFVPE